MNDGIVAVLNTIEEARNRHPGRSLRLVIGVQRMREFLEDGKPHETPSDLLVKLGPTAYRLIDQERQYREEWEEGVFAVLAAVGSDEPVGQLYGVPCWVVEGAGLDIFLDDLLEVRA